MNESGGPDFLDEVIIQKQYTGDSYRDLTRITNINENLWPGCRNYEENLSPLKIEFLTIT